MYSQVDRVVGERLCWGSIVMLVIIVVVIIAVVIVNNVVKIGFEDCFVVI